MAETGLTERTLTALALTEPVTTDIALPLTARRRELAARLVLMAADAVAVMLTVVAVSILTGAEVTVWSLGLLPFFVLLAKMAGLYDRDQFILHQDDPRRGARRWSRWRRSSRWPSRASGALEFTGQAHPFLLWGLLTVMLMAIEVRGQVRLGAHDHPERVLVIGDAATMVLVKRKLAEDPGLNASVVGRVSAEGASEKSVDRVLGTVDELPALIHEHRVERVIVAPSSGRATTSWTSSGWPRRAGSGSRCFRACWR